MPRLGSLKQGGTQDLKSAQFRAAVCCLEARFGPRGFQSRATCSLPAFKLMATPSCPKALRHHRRRMPKGDANLHNLTAHQQCLRAHEILRGAGTSVAGRGVQGVCHFSRTWWSTRLPCAETLVLLPLSLNVPLVGSTVGRSLGLGHLNCCALI